MKEDTQTPDRDPGRVLLFYRVGIFVLLVVVIALSYALHTTANTFDDLRQAHARLKLARTGMDEAPRPPAPKKPPPSQPAKKKHAPQNLAPVAVADLSARVADIQLKKARKSDVSETFFKSEEASVHMHVIGFEQTCPLHIHRVTEEMTVVVTGEPEITHVFADGKGGLSREDTKGGQGDLFYSPPFCAHRWQNRDEAKMQANLVFATPPFDGNFYLEPDDKRMLKGKPPARFEPDKALEALKSSGKSTSQEVLSGMQGKMSALVTTAPVTLDAHSGEQILYVARGKGRVTSEVTLDIKPQTLVIVQPDKAVQIEPGEGEGLVIYAFKAVLGGK